VDELDKIYQVLSNPDLREIYDLEGELGLSKIEK
jgi:curved DNA-binding protein CbpA